MEDGNHPDEEASLQVAHLGQVRKECQIAIRDDIPIQLVKPLDGDEPTDFGMAGRLKWCMKSQVSRSERRSSIGRIEVATTWPAIRMDNSVGRSASDDGRRRLTAMRASRRGWSFAVCT